MYLSTPFPLNMTLQMMSHPLHPLRFYVVPILTNLVFKYCIRLAHIVQLTNPEAMKKGQRDTALLRQEAQLACTKRPPQQLALEASR